MDKRALPSLIALLAHGLGFFLYLILLYNGFWVAVYLKACMYVFISTMFLFLIIDEWDGCSNYLQWQFNLINKIVFIFNFVLAAFTILGIFDSVLLMELYALSIAITSLFILISGIKNGLFKQND